MLEFLLEAGIWASLVFWMMGLMVGLIVALTSPSAKIGISAFVIWVLWFSFGAATYVRWAG
jgi:hypothetical protein